MCNMPKALKAVAAGYTDADDKGGYWTIHAAKVRPTMGKQAAHSLLDHETVPRSHLGQCGTVSIAPALSSQGPGAAQARSFALCSYPASLRRGRPRRRAAP